MAETAGRSQHTSRLAGANIRTSREEDEDGRKEEEWEDEEEGGDEEEETEGEEEEDEGGEEEEEEEEEERATSAWNDARIRPYTIFLCRRCPAGQPPIYRPRRPLC